MADVKLEVSGDEVEIELEFQWSTAHSGARQTDGAAVAATATPGRE
jgi:hypothetical protein